MIICEVKELKAVSLGSISGWSKWIPSAMWISEIFASKSPTFLSNLEGNHYDEKIFLRYPLNLTCREVLNSMWGWSITLLWFGLNHHALAVSENSWFHLFVKCFLSRGKGFFLWTFTFLEFLILQISDSIHLVLLSWAKNPHENRDQKYATTGYFVCL